MVAELRAASARVAAVAQHVRINTDAIPAYAAALHAVGQHDAAPDPVERTAAFCLTLAAVNFGSGWFPTLRKMPGRSGYDTVAAGVRARFRSAGPWTARELTRIDAAELGAVTGQDPGHELMALFAALLRDLGAHLLDEFDGSFSAPVQRAGSSALALVDTLASWRCFEDFSHYDGLELPFLKRAQLAAADLARAGAAPFSDIAQLTMFADNLVPHVLRLDGVLTFDDELCLRIEREELIAHGSAEEVEIRACALHAVELIVAAAPGLTAAGVDELLWNRGREARYKASPRHRSRCTAY
jgi:hypothetical protein